MSLPCVYTSASSRGIGFHLFLPLLAGYGTIPCLLGIDYSSSDSWSRMKWSGHIGWLRGLSSELTWKCCESRRRWREGTGPKKLKLLPERVCSVFRCAFHIHRKGNGFSGKLDDLPQFKEDKHWTCPPSIKVILQHRSSCF